MTKLVSQISYINKYTKGKRKSIILIFLFSIIISLLTILFSVVNKYVFDKFSDIDFKVLLYITCFMAIVYISFVGINFIYKVILNKTSNSIKIEMRMSFYKSIQNIKFTEYQRFFL